ncbi:hypothetical protein CKO51_03795 [Rhodopirellula sp. SM50]|nr:hypothetical protein [Rhodopirellula sp. SM50]PAY20873.1 hypothetical protein CKO51_03795 [Rhodopirellula sp. SM50]
MSLTTTQGEQRVLLRSISWQTYDQGLLEIMSSSMAHESDKSLLGRLVEMDSLVRRRTTRVAATRVIMRSQAAC